HGGRLRDSELHGIEAAAAENNILPSMLREIDDHVGPLGWPEHQHLDRDGRRKQSLVRTNLLKLQAVFERQRKESTVGRIQHSKAIRARLNLAVWSDPAVHQKCIPKNFR